MLRGVTDFFYCDQVRAGQVPKDINARLFAETSRYQHAIIYCKQGAGSTAIIAVVDTAQTQKDLKSNLRKR